MKYDFLVVGSGLFGSVFAHLAKKKKYKCLVIDKRDHIGGNCYTEKVDNIDIHKYGPHIFNTSNKYVWDFVKQFSEFNNFIYTPKARYKRSVYSLPINMMTFYQIYGSTTPEEARLEIKRSKIQCKNPKNLEEHILSQVGEEIYEILIKHYTKKQWGRDPKDLPASIIKRIPIRYEFNENYYNKTYQGIPITGYTDIFNKMLDGIDIQLGVDLFRNKTRFSNLARKIVYTGCIDEYFNYEYGKLDYRTLNIDHYKIRKEKSQGNVAINFTDKETPLTRTIEYNYFTNNIDTKYIQCSSETPLEHKIGDVPYYPINDKDNSLLFEKYKEKSKKEKNVFFGGRLAEYKYLNMDQVVLSSLNLSKRLL